MRRIAFINEKGGSCKTTLAVNMAAFFALKKKRTLLIDMDPQGQVGKALGVDVRNAPVTMLELLTDANVGVPEAAIASRIPGLDLIVANKRLIDLPMFIANDADRNHKLQKKLENVTGYDFIVVDSPPSLGALTLNIMLAVDEIVIPVSLTFFALDGCAEILDTVNQVRSAYDRSDLRVSAVVPTLYRNTNLANDILDKLKAQFGNRVARTVVGFNVKIDEAQSHGKTIWEYAPSSSGAKVMADLAAEIYRIKD